MKFKLIVLLVAAIGLTACQQEDNKPAEPVAEKKTDIVQPETAKKDESAQKTVEAEIQDPPAEPLVTTDSQSHDDHDHSAAGHNHGEPQAAYQIVEPQVECSEPVVIEFYAYQCPHCYTLEPAAEAWRKRNKGKVKFKSVPWDLGRQQFGSLILVHHAAKLLGIQEKVQHALFERVHKEQKLFASADEAAQFLAAHGADADKAKTVLEDQEAIGKSISADYELLAKYKISSVPQLLINHKYLTSLSAAGSPEGVFAIVDEALKLESSCSN